MIERQAISWKRLFVRHLLWVPLIPLIIGLVFALMGAVFLGQARELARDGVEGVAVVTNREIHTRTDSDGNRTTRYLVSYRFQPTSDQTVRGESSVGRAYYTGVIVGQEVPVRFLPRDPGVSELEPGGVILPVIFIGVGGVLVAIGLGLGWFMLGNKLSALRAARHGEVREAKVTGHVPTNTQINGQTQYRFEWVDAANQHGESTMMDFGALPAPGAVLRVYIDPRSGRGWSEQDF